MRLSTEKLAAEAESTGFRPDVLEKVAHLIGLLDTLQSHPFLKGKLVVGTSLRYPAPVTNHAQSAPKLNMIKLECKNTFPC